MATALRALIWDVDGTLAETERDGHRVAFNEAFAAMGLPWRWSVERYGELLATSGGLERLLHDLATHDDAPRIATERLALAHELHRRKNTAYAALMARGTIALRPGVPRLMQEARAAGARLAIATTTGRANVAALLSRHLGAEWADGFAAIVCAEEASRKKPHPLAYQLALAQLGVPPVAALAIEDSPNGLASARAAGVPVLITHSAYFATFDTQDALAVCAHLDAQVRSRCGRTAPRVRWPWLCGLNEAAHAATEQQPRNLEG